MHLDALSKIMRIVLRVSLIWLELFISIVTSWASIAKHHIIMTIPNITAETELIQATKTTINRIISVHASMSPGELELWFLLIITRADPISHLQEQTQSGTPE